MIPNEETQQSDESSAQPEAEGGFEPDLLMESDQIAIQEETERQPADTPESDSIPPVDDVVAEPPAEPVVEAVVEKPVAEGNEPLEPEFPEPAQPAEQPKRLTPEEISTQRTSALQALSKQYSDRIPAGLLADILTEPDKAEENLRRTLSEMAATAQMGAYEAAFATIMGELPKILNVHSQAHTQSTTNAQKFFTAYPQLNDPKYHPQVANMTRTFQQLFPKASLDQAIEWVGNQTLHLFNMQAQQPAAAPKAPRARTPMQVAPPFNPARGGGSAPPAPAKPKNFYEVFSTEIEEVQR